MAPLANKTNLSCLVLLFASLPHLVQGQFAVEKCVADALASNKLSGDDFWTARPRGLDAEVEFIGNDTSNVITLSYKGCVKACTSKPRYNSASAALGILTNWILPLIALISNLPFESGAHQAPHGEYQYLDDDRLHARWWARLRHLRIPRTNFFEPLVNWIGSPQTALAGTLHSIHMLNTATAMVKTTARRHAKEAKEDRATQGRGEQQKRIQDRRKEMMTLRNVLFIACCLAQYDFAAPERHGEDDEGAVHENLKIMERRDRVLRIGLLLPLCDTSNPPPPAVVALLRGTNICRTEGGQPMWPKEEDECFERIRLVRALIPLLAHHLHLLRRRGMYPLAISILWFMAAFAIGIYQSFREVGNYMVAHSLAVGLLLSWLPILVLMSIADRNPNGVERCTDLIERWLYNVDQVLYPEGSEPVNQVEWWDEGDECSLVLGEYIGQGRYLRYTGAGDYLMRQISNRIFDHQRDEMGQARKRSTDADPEADTIRAAEPHDLDPSAQHEPSRSDSATGSRSIHNLSIVSVDAAPHTPLEPEMATPTAKLPHLSTQFVGADLDNIRREMAGRGWSWWGYWLAGEFIVSIAIFAALTVAFNTPTIGFGCRAFSYMIQWALSTMSWLIIGIAPTPKEWQRCISLVFNSLSACFFILLMVFQTAGVYNNCFCQSSLFGSKHYFGIGNWGGYVQFADASFYERAYHVNYYWYTATAVGVASCVGCSAWAFAAWYRSRPLWDEKWGREVEHFARARAHSVAVHAAPRDLAARAALNDGLYAWLS